MDVGKTEVFAIIRDTSAHATRPWKTKQPSEIGDLITVLRTLAAARPLVVAMESTGTYGDALLGKMLESFATEQHRSTKAEFARI